MANEPINISGTMKHYEFIQGLKGITPRHLGCVATIGSFDGVHIGHRALLTSLDRVGQRLNLPTLAMIFEPQPYEFFSKERAPARLTRLREKVDALFAAGVERVLCMRFDSALRSMTADAFVQQVLVARLGIAHLEIGDDFRFGCDRRGDFTMLQRAGQQFGFSVSDTKTLTLDGIRVSSTRVRELLEQDALGLAEAFLGRAFTVTGRVIYGRQLGRSIGVPTANIGLGRHRSPVQGVYVVRVSIVGQQGCYPGVANVGVKPTVTGQHKPVLEVHLLDFEQNLYGSCLQVQFCHKLRAEQKFASLDALKQQISCDIAAARQWLQLPTVP